MEIDEIIKSFNELDEALQDCSDLFYNKYGQAWPPFKEEIERLDNALSNMRDLVNSKNEP